MHKNIKIPYTPGRPIQYPDKGQFILGSAFTGLQRDVTSQIHYYGWHGRGKQIGIVVELNIDSNVILYPINSKEKPGPCELVIPQDPEVIENVANELLRIAKMFRANIPKTS